MALLLMATVVITGIGLGHVILTELQQSVLTDQSILSYYAAETGLESTLYKLRNLNYAVADLPLAGNLDNGAAWQMQYAFTRPDVTVDIAENQTYQLDIFDPDDLSWAPGVEALRFVWEGSGNLEIAYISWIPAPSITWPEEDYYVESPVSFVAPAVYYTNIDGMHGYRIRLKAIDGDIENLNITGWSTDVIPPPPGTQEPLPSHITFNSTGYLGRARQAISASIPRFNQLSGIFDFVLFSEAEVSKE